MPGYVSSAGSKARAGISVWVSITSIWVSLLYSMVNSMRKPILAVRRKIADPVAIVSWGWNCRTPAQDGSGKLERLIDCFGAMP